MHVAAMKPVSLSSAEVPELVAGVPVAAAKAAEDASAIAEGKPFSLTKLLPSALRVV
jgi:translation elongation factor EF-Ts